MDARGRPLNDSPWFWTYLFATAALIALLLISHKYSLRQAQIEREYQGLQRTVQAKSGQQPSVELSSAERTLITLRPLFIGLTTMTVLAYIVFLLTCRRTVRSVP
jgi:hypothetical protein